MCGCISALNERFTTRTSLGSFKKVKSECFATPNARFNNGSESDLLPFFSKDGLMENLKIYEVDPAYINYLSPYAPHLFLNKKPGQTNERKYVGIVLHINGYDYFAPLSAFKEKHRRMNETLDFIKIKDYAVINLNNMFPGPEFARTYVNISQIKDPHYKSLLLAEYRYIKSIQEKIRKNAKNVYKIKLKDGGSSLLAKRCNDFTLLEKYSTNYSIRGN